MSRETWSRKLVRLGPPPHCASSLPPGTSALASARNRRSWSRIQWKVAVLKIASTGCLSSASAVGAEVDDAPSVAGEVRPRAAGHRLRVVDRDHATSRHAVEEQPGEQAGATAGVEYRLVASKGEAIEDALPPRVLGIGEAVAGVDFPAQGVVTPTLRVILIRRRAVL